MNLLDLWAVPKILLPLVIWSTAESFGGPYMAGSTYIGAAIIYFMLHLTLWLGKSWRYYSVDSRLKRKYSFSIGRWQYYPAADIAIRAT
ncbi:MAG: hypothetical protein ACREGH_01285 [Minisyncoccia bacterium]